MNINEFKKKKEFLICVDSDGCAIDSMDVKHFNCFGPCMIQEYGLEEYKDEILDRWNEVNLYTLTRGINRFKGLAKALLEINEKYKTIEDVQTFADWTEKTNELSNNALMKEIEKNPYSISLTKALSWSNKVNEAITKLPIESKKPYENVLNALIKASKVADVAIVSSANLDAVMEEWVHYGLINHVDLVLAQNAGTKTICIRKLLEKGYKKENVLMCGDSMGDLKAAQDNDVYYYPIKARKEKESWQEFIDVALDRLVNNAYTDEYQQQKINEFINNLSGNK